MSRHVSALALAGLWVVWCGVSAGAETLRCQSINGNLNCAGSNGVSCQTINGRKTCVSGHGDVVQSFGAGVPPDIATAGDDGADDPGGHGLPRHLKPFGWQSRIDGLPVDGE